MVLAVRGETSWWLAATATAVVGVAAGVYLARLASRSSGVVEDARPSSASRKNAPRESRSDARARHVSVLGKHAASEDPGSPTTAGEDEEDASAATTAPRVGRGVGAGGPVGLATANLHPKSKKPRRPR